MEGLERGLGLLDRGEAALLGAPRRRRERTRQAGRGGGAAPVDPKAQRNFTDGDAKIMKDGASGAFVAGYNAQLAVDAASQVIVAKELTQRATDVQELPAILTQVRRNTGRQASTGQPGQRTRSDARTGRTAAHLERFLAGGRDRPRPFTPA